MTNKTCTYIYSSRNSPSRFFR